MSMSNAVLAFDFATSTGWAMAQGDTILYGSVDLGAGCTFKGTEHRHGYIFKQASSLLDPERLCNGYTPQAVFFEDVGIGQAKGTPTVQIIFGLRCLTLLKCHKLGIHPVPFGTSHWKKQFGLKGNCGKEAVTECVNALGFDCDNNDQSDALGILNAGLLMYGCSLKDFKHKHKGIVQ